MRAADRWRGRAATLEAMLLLALARLLVARVPLARWRASLGGPAAPEPGDPAVHRDGNLAARRLSRAVARAADRLPGDSRCLPQAMALQWLLRRRGLGAVLHIGIRPERARGGLDDLHAWVVRDGEILIGAGAEPHHPVLAVGPPEPGRADAAGATAGPPTLVRRRSD